MAIDETLRNVEDNAICECAVRLYPPGILVAPHANALRVPGLVFTLGVPARDVHVMHAAVMKRRALGIMALERHVSGRHMTNANHSEFSNLAVCDETLNFLVIPSVAVEQIHSYEPITRLNFANQLPFRGNVCTHRLLRQDMLAAGQSLTNLERPRIGKREQANDINGTVRENDV